jgi:hypothetical protein
MPGSFMKIIGYKLVSHRVDYLEKEVNELLAQGWQPLGAPGIAAAPPHSDLSDTVYQAMVLYGDSKSPAE